MQRGLGRHLIPIVAAVLAAGATTAGATAPPEPPVDQTLDAAPRADVALPGLLDPADAAIPDDPDVRMGTLPNGLRYYVRHNEQPGGKAELRLAIRAGSANETGPNSGVAHFVEHMLFNGTARYPENELIDVLSRFGARFGADINAYTSYDETVYMLSVPNDDESVDIGLDVLHEWLTAASFDPAQVEAERGIVTDEWRRSTQDVGGRLFDVAEDLYLAGTAYEGRSPIGTAESIGAVPVAELRQYYDDWYRPDNAAIVVTGDIDAEAIVADIEGRFADATPRTPEAPKPPNTSFGIDIEPAFALHSDPDQTSVDVEVTLPLPAFEGSGTARLRADILDSMIFESLIRRLSADASTGGAPFDDVVPGTNSFVDSLDAPALYAFTGPDRVDETLQALLDEYERASRFGFDQTELDVARASLQSSFDSMAASAESTPDEVFADDYVANFLIGSAMPSTAEFYATATDMLAAITPEALDLRFRARWDNSAPHVIISSPAAYEADMPTEADVLAMIDDLASRPIEPRATGAEAPAALMIAPEPVAPTSDGEATGGDAGIYEAFELVFPNGARVVAAPTDIVVGEVGFGAASPGGTSLVADEDVIDALSTADVVMSSGVGDVGQNELEAYLAGHSAGISAWLTPYTDNLAGRASSSDLETLFQLVHLYVTAPRFDPVALTQVQRGMQPVVDDVSTSPGAAGSDALHAARYGDEPRFDVVPTGADFATLDLAGVERVWRDRFGDVGDWVFTFAGDFDPAVLRDLAARYIGTLPGSPGAEPEVDLDTPPPDGVVREVVHAGTGETANLTLLFTSAVPDTDASLEATLDVVTQVVDARLIEVIRERLGESYSPNASITVRNDPEPTIVTEIEVSGAPDRIEAVGGLVIAELADLAASGPTADEFDEASAQIAEAYRFVNNGTVIETLLAGALDPEGNAVDFIEKFDALPGVDAADVQAFIATHLSLDQFIQIAVEPV
jgi:zinc protease